VLRDARQHILKSGEGVHFDQLVGGDETAQHRCCSSGAITAEEGTVVAADGEASQRPLGGMREHGSRPVLERLHGYLLEIKARLLPTGETGQAVAHALKNWTALTRYCQNPDLAIDNHRA
jgi:hypothetical protein